MDKRKTKRRVDDAVSSSGPKKRKSSSTSAPVSKTQAPWFTSSVSSMAQALACSNRHNPTAVVTTETKMGWIKRQLYQQDVHRHTIQIDANKEDDITPKQVVHTTSRSKRSVSSQEVVRSRKIRIYPNGAQRKVLHRFTFYDMKTYNQTLYMKCHLGYPYPDMPTGWMQMETLMFDELTNPIREETPWLFDASLSPRDLRKEAVHSFFSAMAATKEAMKAKKKKDPSASTHFKMKYRSVHDSTQRFKIPVNGGRPNLHWQIDDDDKKYTGFTFWPRQKIGVIRAKSREVEVIVKYTRPHRWYIVIPIRRIKPSPVDEYDDRPLIVGASDPGVRTFQSTYSPEVGNVDYGAGASNRLLALATQCDRLQGQVDDAKNIKTENKSRFWYRKKYKEIGRLRFKMQDLKKDIHEKVGNDMLHIYDHILMPTFQTSQMVKKHTNKKKPLDTDTSSSSSSSSSASDRDAWFSRKIGKTTVRQMMSLGHYRFRVRLKEKAEMLSNWHKRVHDVSEHYTTKACSECGYLNHDIQASEVHSCESCGLVRKRDHGAPKNIWMMNVEQYVGDTWFVRNSFDHSQQQE
jgi:putative transposase